MKKITDFHELQCWKLSTELCTTVYELCEQADLPSDDELACRWHVAVLNISGKIAFAYGPENVDWFKKRLPLAWKYCAESYFRTQIVYDRGLISTKDYEKVCGLIKRIKKKIDSIARYLNKYSENEKYKWRVFFEELDW